MNDIQHIITERVDDIPLLLEQSSLQGSKGDASDGITGVDGLPLSRPWPLERTQSGLGQHHLAQLLSRGDHRLSHAEPWGANRLWTLETATDPDVDRLDFTDDRLEIVLRQLSDDSRWAQFESRLNQHTVRVYDLSTERIHVDSITASAYASVSEAGLFQFGPSKEHRPDLPQVKVMQAVLDPLAIPLEAVLKPQWR